jgi:hypothetical protein
LTRKYNFKVIMKGKIMKIYMRTALSAALLCFFSVPALAAVTNLTLVGGCPSGEDDPFCYVSGNDTTTNVALLLGVPETDLTQITSGYTINGEDGGTFENYGTTSGTWSISDSSITHLAFKANGYYILGEVTGSSGDWSTDITMWTPDVTTLTCPAGICDVADRFYTLGDFLNGGENTPALSHVGAYNVVPIPAAVWLFGSALGFLGWTRRSKLAA